LFVLSSPLFLFPALYLPLPFFASSFTLFLLLLGVSLFLCRQFKFFFLPSLVLLVRCFFPSSFAPHSSLFLILHLFLRFFISFSSFDMNMNKMSKGAPSLHTAKADRTMPI
jgi:hypothetical protein